MQGYDRYTGYAWYRCHLRLTPAPGLPVQFALLVGRVDDAYEIYWNGRLIGQNGRLDPYRIWYWAHPPKIFPMTGANRGVLAVRVWKSPLFSDDSGQRGGFEVAPRVGSPAAIAADKEALDYQWLRDRQFLFGENLLYALVALLGFLAWWRNQSRWFLFWMGAFALVPPLLLLLLRTRLLWPYVVVIGLEQPIYVLGDVSLWFLLLWLLPLRDKRGIRRLTRILAQVVLINAILDAIVLSIAWSPRWIGPAKIVDDLSAAIYSVLEAFPLVLVAVALTRRRRLDAIRWVVAILAVLDELAVVVQNVSQQGIQYTNWSLAARIEAPLFTVGGSGITVHTLTGALLLIALVYAAYGRLREDQRQKEALERERGELLHTREQMRHFAEHDDLTGLWNHRIIMDRLAGEVDRAQREGTQLSVILADVDHFKNVNDRFGHPTGDLVLREVSAIFVRSVRTYDWVGRYGGEEFLIILPGSDFGTACLRAEELRAAVEAAVIADGERRLQITSSFGVASGFPADHGADAVVRVVDAALYEAKRCGRNRVIATDMNVDAAMSVDAAGN
jgi:diguanylate cyclase (GGDEF)-like protein